MTLYLLETHGKATLAEVHDLSKREMFFSWLEEETNENEFSTLFIQNAHALLGAEERTQKSILKDFHSRMSLFSDPLVRAATKNNDFDFRELRREKISIYIHIPDADKERLTPVLTLFWSQLINAMSSHVPSADEPYGVLALMDEFGNMARIPKLKDGMSFLRSYHIRPVIIVQHLSQITSIYGRDDAKGFLNSKVKVAFALNDIDDATFFSKSMGSKTVYTSSNTISSSNGNNFGSHSRSTSARLHPLMSADEIMQLPKSKAIVLMEGRSPLKINKCYWFKSKYKSLPRSAGLKRKRIY